MDQRSVLIYHFSSKNNNWYDATDNILWYKDTGKSWSVRFKNSDKAIHVSYNKMYIYSNPKKIDFVALFYKGKYCREAEELICFADRYYKIFYKNGFIQPVKHSEISAIKDELKKSPHALGVMSYYRRVVDELANPDDPDDKFLVSQFEDIDYVNEDSVLSLYLEKKIERRYEHLLHPLICPFGINLSQLEALSMAFNNRMSIIEGPPGTGKTQTILNFIANAVINGKSIAVVSNNNSATDNVFEKLEKYGYSFFAARLGNSDNIDKFFEEYTNEIPYIEKHNVDKNVLINLRHSLPKFFESENKKKKLEAKLDAIKLEHQHFLADNSEIDFSQIKFKLKEVNSNVLLKLVLKLKETNWNLIFWRKLYLKIKFKIKKDLFKTNTEDLNFYIENLYYISKINEIEKEIKKLNDEMNNQSFMDKVNEFTTLSKLYFETQLATIFNNEDRGEYERSNYKRQFGDFIRDYPVILSSTYSLAQCSKKGYLFDYLIVDESSQVNMASAILSMRVAKNIVVVGDIQQLPQIDDSDFKDKNKQLLEEYKVSDSYSYYGNSIMSSLLKLYGDKIPKTMLREHYRCNPYIIGFCNKRFYNNELIVYSNNKNEEYSMKVIKTVAGNFARKNPNDEGSGCYNQREIDEIKQLLDKESLDDVGVIAPYRYHAEKVKEQLGDTVDASTVHKFQGREKKTIIFSSVTNDINSFVANDNLINVAVSRAVDKFILITSDKIANSNNSVLSDLVNYIKYHQDFGKIEEGNVKSIYDLLYEDYQEVLAKFRRKRHSKEIVSEELTKATIETVLNNHKFNNLWFAMHVSLKDFILNKNLELTNDEYKFYKNPNAHADFLIYNKISHKPVLVIEVDGVSFHEQQKKQRERDDKKNRILEKSCINILRLKTNESNEQERIINKLNELFS